MFEKINAKVSEKNKMSVRICCPFKPPHTKKAPLLLQNIIFEIHIK